MSLLRFLINAPMQIFGTAEWTDAVGAIVFIALLMWVFGLSIALVRTMHKGADREGDAPTPRVTRAHT